MGFFGASVFELAADFAWSSRGRFCGGRNVKDWNAVSPAYIDRGADEAGTGGIFKHCDIADFAGKTAEVGELFNGQLQCVALVNKDGGAMQDKLNGGPVANHECGQGGTGELTLIRLSLAAAFAGI
jgi:hypothetical protein